jgi:hypothetical protein
MPSCSGVEESRYPIKTETSAVLNNTILSNYQKGRYDEIDPEIKNHLDSFYVEYSEEEAEQSLSCTPLSVAQIVDLLQASNRYDFLRDHHFFFYSVEPVYASNPNKDLDLADEKKYYFGQCRLPKEARKNSKGFFGALAGLIDSEFDRFRRIAITMDDEKSPVRFLFVSPEGRDKSKEYIRLRSVIAEKGERVSVNLPEGIEEASQTYKYKDLYWEFWNYNRNDLQHDVLLVHPLIWEPYIMKFKAINKTFGQSI